MTNIKIFPCKLRSLIFAVNVNTSTNCFLNVSLLASFFTVFNHSRKNKNIFSPCLRVATWNVVNDGKLKRQTQNIMFISCLDSRYRNSQPSFIKRIFYARKTLELFPLVFLPLLIFSFRRIFAEIFWLSLLKLNLPGLSCSLCAGEYPGLILSCRIFCISTSVIIKRIWEKQIFKIKIFHYLIRFQRSFCCWCGRLSRLVAMEFPNDIHQTVESHFARLFPNLTTMGTATPALGPRSLPELADVSVLPLRTKTVKFLVLKGETSNWFLLVQP